MESIIRDFHEHCVKHYAIKDSTQDLWNHPFPNETAAQALQAYEDGEGRCVIVSGFPADVATDIFWNKLTSSNRWYEVPVPKEAQPYIGYVKQSIRVFKSQ